MQGTPAKGFLKRPGLFAPSRGTQGKKSALDRDGANNS